MDTYKKGSIIKNGADPLETTRGVDAYELDRIAFVLHIVGGVDRSDHSDKPKEQKITAPVW